MSREIALRDAFHIAAERRGFLSEIRRDNKRSWPEYIAVVRIDNGKSSSWGVESRIHPDILHRGTVEDAARYGQKIAEHAIAVIERDIDSGLVPVEAGTRLDLEAATRRLNAPPLRNPRYCTHHTPRKAHRRTTGRSWRPPGQDMTVVICPYCGERAVLVDSSEVYRRSYGMIWLCRPCQAWVGVHKNSPDHKPLGTLANAELRGWRQRVHAAFDPKWKTAPEKGRRARSKARLAHYGWLAKKLGVRYQDCHIGMFDIEQCKRVIEACG